MQGRWEACQETGGQGDASATPSTGSTPSQAAPPVASVLATSEATPIPTPTAQASATTAGGPPSVAPTSGAPACPTAATVNAALGTKISAPIGVAGGGKTKLPAGATGEACEYAGTGQNVIIELITNIKPSSISLFSAKFPVAAQSVSGVGDQARAFSQSLNGGKTNEGVVAVQGTTLVSITTTGTPASLAQVEALAKQLL